MSAEVILFWVFSCIACVGAIAVVITQSVVRMAVWLMVSLSSVSLFFLLHADFVGATQLLMYVGGTVVRLIFGGMLTASGPYRQIKSSPAEGVLAGMIAIMFLAMLVSTISSVDWSAINTKLASVNKSSRGPGYNLAETGNTIRPIGMALLGLRADKGFVKGQKEFQSGTEQLETGYLLPFEIASVHLLVVLIGAAYLARAKRRVDASVES